MSFHENEMVKGRNDDLSINAMYFEGIGHSPRTSAPGHSPRSGLIKIYNTHNDAVATKCISHPNYMGTNVRVAFVVRGICPEGRLSGRTMSGRPYLLLKEENYKYIVGNILLSLCSFELAKCLYILPLVL